MTDGLGDLVKEIVLWYAANDTTPGDGWAMADDKSCLCFEDTHRVTGHAFWIDLDADGGLHLLWRPSKDVAARSIRLKADPVRPAESPKE